MTPEQEFLISFFNNSSTFIDASTNVLSLLPNKAQVELGINYRKASEYEEDLIAFYTALAINPLLMADVKYAIFWIKKFNSESEKITNLLTNVGAFTHVSDVIGTLSDESRFNNKECILTLGANLQNSSLAPFVRDKIPSSVNDMINELNIATEDVRLDNLQNECKHDISLASTFKVSTLTTVASICATYLALVKYYSSVGGISTNNPFNEASVNPVKITELDLIETIGKTNLLAQYMCDDRRKLNIEVLK